MQPATPAWSERRRDITNRVAAALYGVIAILTAEPAIEPGEVSFVEAAVGALLRAASYAFAFPAPTAAVILIAAALGLRWRALIDLVAYLSIGAVFLLGFGSSYVLDDKPVPALLRAVTWTALGRVLFAAKKFL